ncbi:MAG: SCO family protein [Bacteroidota bacterium]|nr:SCO family protein [Bacteroidota bacterium]
MTHAIRSFTVFVCLLLLFSCKEPPAKLPFLGEPLIIGKDTSYPVIAPFLLMDQDSNQVSNESLRNKIYVADFIFLSCPSICPIITQQMRTVYQAFESDPRVAFVSHSIDPKHDTIPRLKAYASMLGVKAAQWHFVTGNKDSILNLSNKSYFSAAYPDSTAPGGFTHSGGLLLIDRKGHIRGVYDGTNAKETTRLKSDIDILLKEQF